jgi:hypothetical protein
MSYSIIPVDKFKKEAKRLIKKYPSLKDELIELSNKLEQNPTMGTALGNNTFKIRLSIKSKGSGKSGGARIITYLVNGQNEVYLLTIYDKADLDTVEDAVLKKIIQQIKFNK